MNVDLRQRVSYLTEASVCAKSATSIDEQTIAELTDKLEVGLGTYIFPHQGKRDISYPYPLPFGVKSRLTLVGNCIDSAGKLEIRPSESTYQNRPSYIYRVRWSETLLTLNGLKVRKTSKFPPKVMFQVARLQLDIANGLRQLYQSRGRRDRPISEAISSLSRQLYDLTTLYEQYADTFNLVEMKLR